MVCSKEEVKDAICQNNVHFFKENLSKIDINNRFEDEDNDTLLLYSLSYEYSTVYRFLMKEGASLQVKNDFGETVIHSAVYSGDWERVQEMLKAVPDLIDEKTKDGMTPLLLSIALGEVEVAIKLIESGADVNISDNNGVLPIHVACQEGILDLVLLLIEYGANLLVKTNLGNLPMALAINKEKHDVVKLLYSVIYKEEGILPQQPTD